MSPSFPQQSGAAGDQADPSEGLRLIKAFTRVSSPTVRAAIIVLAERMADATESRGPRSKA
jgi:hypothetical protein